MTPPEDDAATVLVLVADGLACLGAVDVPDFLAFFAGRELSASSFDGGGAAFLLPLVARVLTILDRVWRSVLVVQPAGSLVNA